MPEPRPLAAFSEENQVFVEALRSGDAEVIRDALAEMSSLVDDELADELLRLAAVPGDDELRGDVLTALAVALELFETDEIIGEDDDGLAGPDFGALTASGFGRVTVALRSIYQDAAEPPLVRRRALEAAVRSPAPWQAPAVRWAWASGDPAWRTTAVFCMAFLSGLSSQDFRTEIAAALRAPEAPVRAEAITAIQELELQDHGQELLALAGDRREDSEVRARAIEALGALAPDGAAELLTRIAAERSDFGPLAEDALHLLGQRAGLDEDLDDDFGDDLDDDPDVLDDDEA